MPSLADAASCPDFATELPAESRLTAFLEVWKGYSEGACNYGAATFNGPLSAANLQEMCAVEEAMRDEVAEAAAQEAPVGDERASRARSRR